MKRRRIEVRIERHEFSIFSETRSQPTTQTQSQTPPTQTQSQGWPNTRSHVASSREESALLGGGAILHAPNHAESLCCPICGADEMLPLAEAISEARLTAIALKEGLEAGRYHLHCSPAGDWLLCVQSMRLD